MRDCGFVQMNSIGQFIYGCRICNEDFTTSASLEYHSKNAHSLSDFSEAESSDSSSESERESKKKKSKKQKKKEKKNTKKLKCEYCSNTFLTDGGRKRHITSKHQIEVPFKCNFCPSRFKTVLEKVNHEMERHSSTTNLRQSNSKLDGTFKPFSFL